MEDHSISSLLRLETNALPKSCVPCVFQAEICLQSVDFLVLEHMAAQDHIYKTGMTIHRLKHKQADFVFDPLFNWEPGKLFQKRADA